MEFINDGFSNRSNRNESPAAQKGKPSATKVNSCSLSEIQKEIKILMEGEKTVKDDLLDKKNYLAYCEAMYWLYDRRGEKIRKFLKSKAEELRKEIPIIEKTLSEISERINNLLPN